MRRLLLVFLLLAVAAQAEPRLTTLEGRTLSPLEGTKGPVVLTVWCSYCGSCRSKERDLDRLSRQAGARVIAVSPHPADTPERISHFLRENDLHFEVMRDPDQSFILSHAIEKTTTTLVYDKNGRVKYFGPFGEDVFRCLSDLAAGREVESVVRPQQGCPIPTI